MKDKTIANIIMGYAVEIEQNIRDALILQGWQQEHPTIGGDPISQKRLDEIYGKPIGPANQLVGMFDLPTKTPIMTPTFEPYILMVERLFKKLPNKQMECHHATTGLSGEAAELLAATSRVN